MKRVNKNALAAISLLSAVTVLSSCTDDLVNTSALYGPADAEPELISGYDLTRNSDFVYGPAATLPGQKNHNGNWTTD